MQNSKIEWTTHTFNPWWGCTKVSPGCQFCYAERDSTRYGHDVWGPGKPRRLLSDEYWKQPLKWNREAGERGARDRVFCASMADVFDHEAPAGLQARLWEIIEATPNLDWQLLTKRPERIGTDLPACWLTKPRPNVWLGTSIESADYTCRAQELIKIPGVVHFLSVEPLLGPIPHLPLEDIEWVILGGESGPKARPMDIEWARDVMRQCRAAGVPCFVKQLGGRHDKRSNPADWPKDLRVREFPAESQHAPTSLHVKHRNGHQKDTPSLDLFVDDDGEHDCDGCLYCETLQMIEELETPLADFCADDDDPITQRLAVAAATILELLACRIAVDLMDDADEDDALGDGSNADGP